MSQHLYLSLVPEALVASMLEPEDFACYYAVGTESKTRGQAVFIEVDPAFRHPDLPVAEGLARCLPHEDGSPKRSVYIAVYRVLERVPVSVLGRLHLVTKDGRSLALESRRELGADAEGLHLYYELAPTKPAVVSTLGPRGFFDLLMGRQGGFQGLPALAFAELALGELAADPEAGAIGDLPYENLDHLRSCLAQLKTKAKRSKIYDRGNNSPLPYRAIKKGVYVGNAVEGLVLYALPPLAALKEGHHDFWRSAQV